jgi:smad nuclear-interacting protein 1
LLGKDDRVVDILAENPSISRQHCVIQFRLVQKRQTEGEYIETIKPYVMDLESTNGTFLNDERIESGRYYELLHRDVLKFGFSDREYVIVKWD